MRTMRRRGGKTKNENKIQEPSIFDKASTPQLIEQSLKVGGELAASVSDKWVADSATGLSFYWNTTEKKMFCYNASNLTFYEWKGAGQMVFISQGQMGGGAQVQQNNNNNNCSMAQQETVLWLTPISPQFLYPQVEEVTVVWDIPSKVCGHLVGKSGAGIQAIRDSSGADIHLDQSGKHTGQLTMTGTKQQVNQAGNSVDQILGKQLGAQAVGNLKKKRDQKHMKDLQEKNKTGQDDLVPGMPAFASKYALDAKSLRRFKKHDLMFRKYVVKHFQPKVAKGKSILSKYCDALLKPPQRWRLEAMQEEQLLEGDCETTPVADTAIIGKLDLKAPESETLRLDLDAPNNRQFGDVQPEHCRILNMMNEFYVLPLESQIGTIVDGYKHRSADGPQPLRDGSVIEVGKYLIYCEIDSAANLQERRQKLMSGESLWGDKAAETAANLNLNENEDDKDEESEEPEEAEEGAQRGSKRSLSPSPGRADPGDAKKPR